MSTRESKLHALNVAQVRRTHNDLAPAARQSAIEYLECLVATAADVSMAARQAHWNVRGPAFLPLHEMFGEIADKILHHVDELAERSAALGGIPRCSAQSVAAGSVLKPYPNFCFDGAEHIEQLSQRLAVLSTALRQASVDLEGSRDPVTAHIMVEACATVEHMLWKLESHLAVDDDDRIRKAGGA